MNKKNSRAEKVKAKKMGLVSKRSSSETLCAKSCSIGAIANRNG
jgi:hypothetical protein